MPSDFLGSAIALSPPQYVLPNGTPACCGKTAVGFIQQGQYPAVDGSAAFT